MPMKVPIGLNRPSSMIAVPRNTAAKVGTRKMPEVVGSYPPNAATAITAPTPLSPLAATKDPNRIRLTRTDARTAGRDARIFGRKTAHPLS